MKATILRPAIPITDSAFRYTPSHETDLGKKFRKLIRAQQQPQQPCPECRMHDGAHWHWCKLGKVPEAQHGQA